MKQLPFFICLAGILLMQSSCNSQTSATNSPESLAREYVQQLSIDEKISLLSGPGYGHAPINLKQSPQGAAGYINGIQRDDMDIPALVLADGPAGVRIYPPQAHPTAWPVATLLASSWDAQLLEDVGQAMGREAKGFGVDVLLAPGTNLQRNPLAGRNFEYYSEDPFISGTLAAAMIRGIQSQGVGATVKHFFGNESETNRMYINVISDPRSLRELYLRPFQIAIRDGSPWAVMSSYNLVNNRYVNERTDALEEILRDEWQFDGLVMSDWYAGAIRSDRDAGARQIQAGNDLIMPGDATALLRDSYDRGFLTEDDITLGAQRVLTQALRLQMGQDDETKEIPFDEHQTLARRAGAEGMVLLKNSDNSLPLEPDSSIALFGVGQLATYAGGTGSGNVPSAYTVDIISGLESQFQLEANLEAFYRQYFMENRREEMDAFASIPVYYAEEASPEQNPRLDQLIEQSAEEAQSAIMVISRQAGEGQDRSPQEGSYLLSNAERSLMSRLAQAFHAQGKMLTVVLNVDSVMQTSDWSDMADAILLAYMGGQETGNQVADIISGRVNPSGRLAQSIPLRYADVPSASTFPGFDANNDRQPDYIINNEGVYVGYRHYWSHDIELAYPFGFGLSYSTFQLSERTISGQNLERGAEGVLELSVQVRNSGQRSGKQVVQVYISTPHGRVDHPEIELKAFGKTNELSPEESQDMSFCVTAEDLASFDAEHNRWFLEAGTYQVYIAESSEVSDIQPLEFTLDSEVKLSETGDALALPEGVNAEMILSEGIGR